MTRFHLKSAGRVWRALLIAPLFVITQTCTSLTEVPHDALTPDNAFGTEAELLAGVAAVYANLRAMEWVGYITIEDLTTDVSIVPTRGSDWYDNGQWLDLHRQTYTANSSGTLAFLNGVWNDPFAGIAKANLMIDVVTKAGGPSAPAVLAELRTLRAWYYYMLQDFFGGAPPLVTTTKLEQSPSSTRTALYAFIQSELTAAVVDLPATRPAAEYGRVTKAAANAILASLYLNSGVFNKNSGVNATSYNSCAPNCQSAVDAANAVINSGLYSLAPAGQWANNFSVTNGSSPENIFVIVYTSESSGLGGCWPWRTLHYNQLNSGGGPWNGFATLAETYNQFTATDERRGMWLAGQAYSFDTGLPAKDRTGAPLIFTTAIPDANQANEAHGVRFNKFPPLPSASGGCGMPNDFPFFRLTEMYLIKAEALNELGQTAAAITELARVHDLRDPANPISTSLTQAQVRAAVLKERLLEFAAEGKRRTDLIRHGQYLNRWSTTMLNGKTDMTAKTHLILMPVPVTQIGSNPNLVQNPGY
jgi:starch-binding outer membrane protein, SusD/RagB family